MKLVLDLFGIQIELEGEIKKEEDKGELVVHVRGVDKAIAKIVKG